MAAGNKTVFFKLSQFPGMGERPLSIFPVRFSWIAYPQALDSGKGIVVDDEDTPYRKLCRMRWAALIKRVYEMDPLLCPKCSGAMKIVAFIEKHDQADVIERIPKHCGPWDRPASRALPKAAAQPVQPPLDLEYVDIDEPRRSRDGLPSRQQWSEAEWQFMMAL